jgi:TonB family protein
VQILENGHAGDVEIIDSSGFSRLDEQAAKMAKERFAYQPGTVDGVPASMRHDMLMSFAITRQRIRPPFYIKRGFATAGQ